MLSAMLTSSAKTIPPLENGDRLTRDEFERRYATMPDGVKAELIEGIVYMAAALRARHHDNPHAQYDGVTDRSSVDGDGGGEGGYCVGVSG